MLYRIVSITEGDGVKYYVQRRFLWFFWSKLTSYVGYAGPDAGPIFATRYFDSIEEAREAISADAKLNKKQKRSKRIIEEVSVH